MTQYSLHHHPKPSMIGHYAGFASRLVAFMIDAILLSTIIVFTSWFVSTSVGMLQGQAILNTLGQRYPIIDQLTQVIRSPLLHSLVSVAFVISYYLFFWTTAGRTPGKYLMGLRVLVKSGAKLKLRHAILRYAGYYLSGLAFGVGFLWILVDDERRGWHDRLAGTLVIYDWDARPDETFLVRVYDELVHRRQALQALVRRKRNRKE
jgi:uncharacterized RDD family membrane protein YckC